MNFPISFEFFPPKNEAGLTGLLKTAETLNQWQPEFFSVTYGAGGSNRANTKLTVTKIAAAGLPVAPHLTFSSSPEELKQLLDNYLAMGINHLVVLRGDVPLKQSENVLPSTSHKRIHAVELVRFLQQHYPDCFTYDVACYPEIHPEAPSYHADIGFLKEKFEAGATRAITQFFFNSDAYFYFVDSCRKAGIHQPILPGIMPIGNVEGLLGFAAKCGAEIPRWLRHRLTCPAKDKSQRDAFALDFICNLCERLIAGGAPGLHFYTLNKAHLSSQICRYLCDNVLPSE